MKWYNREPENSLGVIVYLTTVGQLSQLNASLLSLRQYLFRPRPVVVFHEGDLNDVNIQLALANTLGSNVPLGFEHIRFPTKVNIARTRKEYHIGYSHMCNFFGILLPYHPVISNVFTFYLRLDSHSYLLGPTLTYDLFDYMQINRLQYSFLMVHMDHRVYVKGLWNLFHKFLTHSCMIPSSAVKKTQTSSFTGWYSNAIIFNNFELCNGSLWREPRMEAWLRQVDKSEGIYKYRWGDAPIRTLAVTQFLEKNQVVKLCDIGYSHRHQYTCASHIHPCAVPPHLKGSLNSFYPQGCYPTDNPFCNYYQENT
ncbi:unnamed protein product [Rotaria socialis]|uniref:Uncharacterized protein n=3 Tax=Rotaria socialis TaxID=392032 RepID=A0A820UN87_9BILA|nr:unnamed protein product [Rotaria socialis]CAF3374331.1 unnamed protein product [Rotaria socialis]CAF4487316.1 unnamed protein product [Rotaria socialis]